MPEDNLNNTMTARKEASFWRPLAGDKDGKRVECGLCSFRCKIAEGKRGICGVRENIDGRLISLNYGRVIAAGIDPIEKKPLFHFLPGSLSYSISTVGCNFRCLHCQNAEISQVAKGAPIEGRYVEPKKIVFDATALGAETVAYTYTEPTIFYEYARDVMEMAHKVKLKNIFVTNGYMTEEALKDMDGLLDAANVDLKTFNDKTYKRVCGAKLRPVLDTIERMVALGIWVEVTTLIIPTVNDSDAELREIARWISELGKDIPWHVSAFFPTYKMTDLPPTPVETVRRAREIGLEEGLKYVYSGNLHMDDEGESTFCPGCKEMIIERHGFAVKDMRLKDDACPACKEPVKGLWRL